jgi:pentapeptide MXKDX repeat protein
MRKVWLGIVGAVVCLGLGLAIVGFGSSTPDKDKMGADNMSGEMGADNMSGDKMGADNMGADNISGDKMAGDKMDKK